jgi:hypothetical protein
MKNKAAHRGGLLFLRFGSVFLPVFYLPLAKKLTETNLGMLIQFPPTFFVLL